RDRLLRRRRRRGRDRRSRGEPPVRVGPRGRRARRELRRDRGCAARLRGGGLRRRLQRAGAALRRTVPARNAWTWCTMSWSPHRSRPRRLYSRLVLLAGLVAGCGGGDEKASGPVARFSDFSAGAALAFDAAPFPGDFRRVDGGALSLGSLPTTKSEEP